jgi:nitrogen fixation/metabolism regulation signal transduction histidine kinase
MKIRRKLLLSYLVIVVLFIAAGATITYNTMKMADLQNTVKQQVEINNNAYAYQQGLDQKQFGTLMYSSDNTAEGERIIVASADTMVPAETYLVKALASDPTLLAKFNDVVSLDTNQINGAISQVYTIYTSNDANKYVNIWSQLTTLMNGVKEADLKLADVRSAILANVQNATGEAQNYASLSLIMAVVFIAIISAVSVALSVVMGNRITNPLKKLADIAHKVSLGDLNQRHYLKENIDIKTGDEIDELVNAFRRMINAFRMTEALSKDEPEAEGTDKQ